MAVALRSVGVSPGGASSPVIIAKPAGLTVGDLMIAHVVNKESGTPNPTTTPEGWTEIRQDAGDEVRAALFWKIADGDDVAAANFSFIIDDSGVNNSDMGAISAWTGHDPASPINANNGQYNATSTTVRAPAITPSVAYCMILMIAGISDNNTQSNYAIADDDPGGWTEAYDISTSTGGDCALAIAYDIRPETTATGQGTCTTSAEEKNVGQLVAIAPVAVVTFIPTVMII